MTERSSDGTFPKGKSGNPSGVSSEIRKKILAFKSRALEVCPELLEGVIEYLQAKMKAKEHIGRTDVALIRDIFDRGLGKPAQQITIETESNSESPLEMSRQEIVERLAYLEQALKNK